MPAILLFLLKLSVSLSLVFIFYHTLLRKLTFYNWNRAYLLLYTLLSFFMPFINISPVLEKNNLTGNGMVNWVPSIGVQNQGAEILEKTTTNHLSTWDILIMLIAGGIAVLLIKLFIQFSSYRKMKKKAMPLVVNGLKVYQVDENIIPFSFGSSIFINRQLHSETELQEIIRHEFIHVKQKHSLDIIWGEVLCLLNWYNPFAWMLKKSIRQNLEFIADSRVLENGINKKEYQYLLLKVTGNNQYSIATPFNFSSLKKRIAMMNKLKSAKMHLIKFLFVLPLAAVLLLAFRSRWSEQKANTEEEKKVSVAGVVVDGKTMKPLQGVSIVSKEKNINVTTDANGYYLLHLPVEQKELLFSLQLSKEGYVPFHQEEHWGNFSEDYIFKKFGKTIFVFGLDKTGGKNFGFSNIAGNAADEDGLSYEQVIRKLSLPGKNNFQDLHISKDTVPDPPLPPLTTKLNKLPANVKGVSVNNDKVTIILKNGEKEKYDLNNPEEKKALEKKYGDILPPPPPPSIRVSNAPIEVMGVATSPLYDPVSVMGIAASPTLASAEVRGVAIAPVSDVVEAREIASAPIPAASAISPGMAVVSGNVTIADATEDIITGDEAIVITITKNTTRQQLDEFVKQMKAKGVEMSYDEIEYDSNGILVNISGNLKSKTGHSNFVGQGFSRLVLALMKKGEKTWFKVSVTNGKVTI